MPRRTDDFRGLAQPSRLQLLAEIQRHPGLLLRELAIRTGLHENTVRDHLAVLEAEGLIARRTVHPGTRGRPPGTYHPVRAPEENSEAVRRIDRAARNGDFLRGRARHAAERDEARELSIEALHQLDTLYEHLDDSGFQPDLDDERLEFDLVPCPQYALVEREHDQELVCHVHSQLIRDTLSQVPGPVRLTLLEPHLTPERCRVHLGLDTEGGVAPAREA